MDAKEEQLQFAKLDGIDKMVALLEEIAFNTSSKMIERPVYLERVYASRKQSAENILRDMRARPTARQGEVPQHVQGKDVRVGINPKQRAS